MLGGSDGIGRDQWENGGGAAKKHDFTDDSFDFTAWPKDKSPWED